jgi:hypothetical protein
MDYAKACQDAADRQGITAIVEALAAADIEATVWQTGGFIMVAAVYASDGDLFVVTADGPYLLGRYKDEEGMCTGEGSFSSFETLPELVAELQQHTSA